MAIKSFRYRAYWSETDAAGIVHFSNYFRFLERAEEDFVRWAAGVRWEPGAGVLFPRVHASCDYRAPILPGDEFEVTVEEVLLGRSSIEYRYTVRNLSRGWESASCRVVTVAVDRESFKPIPVPRGLREALLRVGAREKRAAGGGEGV